MPRHNNCDYNKTVIYKIVCKDESITDVYVGSTTNFNARKSGHKSASVRFHNVNRLKHRKLYITIYENGYWENWNMLEIEKYPCADETEALKRERYWYDILKANLNSFKPIKTDEEKQQAIDGYIICKCGLKVSYNKRTRHLKHQKHLIAMKNKEEVQKNESP